MSEIAAKKEKRTLDRSAPKVRYSQESIRKMARMGFDPIVETIKTFHNLHSLYCKGMDCFERVVC